MNSLFLYAKRSFSWLRKKLFPTSHELDQRFLGAAIVSVAQEKGYPVEDATVAVWAIHKILDPSYGPEDLTPDEIAFIKRLDKDNQ